MKLRLPTPEDLFTKCANAEAAPDFPDTPAPLWEAHIREMCARPDGAPNLPKEEFLQRWCGYCLTGLVSEQRFLFICGKARSGKSTFIEVFAWVLGSFAVNISKSVLTGDENAHPTVRMPLVGARWAYIGEELDQKAINVSTFKSLVTGETFTARRMNQDMQTFRSSAKFILEGNERFRVTDQSDGIWRRMILLVIENQVAEEKTNYKDYKEQLKEEGSGILAWAARGCIAWQEKGLAVPEEMEADLVGYRDDEDTVGQFVDACFEGWAACTAGGGVVEPVKLAATEVYSRYQSWCDQSGHRALSAQKLGNQLVSRFKFERGDKNARMYMPDGTKSKILFGRPLVKGWTGA